jgi:hypothetical protein
LLITLKLPVGVPQPSLPEAIGETNASRPSSIKYAACSLRLITTAVWCALSFAASPIVNSAIAILVATLIKASLPGSLDTIMTVAVEESLG